MSTAPSSSSFNIGIEVRGRYCVYGDSWDWLFEKRKKEWKGRCYKQLHGKGTGWSFPLDYASEIESQLARMLTPPPSAPISIVSGASSTSSSSSEDEDRRSSSGECFDQEQEEEQKNHVPWVTDDEDSCDATADGEKDDDPVPAPTDELEHLDVTSTTTSSEQPAPSIETSSSTATIRKYRVDVSKEVLSYFKKYI